jgi:hypothetical protein
MCQSKVSQQYLEVSGCDCGCCGCGPPFRAFLTTDEKLERLKNYRDQLSKELAGVEQRIKEFQ